jgi:hypothetical protein
MPVDGVDLVDEASGPSASRLALLDQCCSRVGRFFSARSDTLKLMEKLAALIPRPRINLPLYRCGGRLRLIATVEDPEAIRVILAALARSREREGWAPPSAAGELPSPAVVLGA